jgi:UDP-2,4-diacetamido-2,4,6-trideoxy-beta-L-altropyranose hydrolase
MKTVYLRADGGTGTGWGHINRLAGLASVLQGAFHTVFVTAANDSNLLNKLRNHADQVLQLASQTQPDFENDFAGLETEGHILVADGYHFPESYFPAARAAGMRTVFIDDFARGPFHCDCIINHAPASATAYGNLPESIRLCDGIAYALLRPVFYTERKGKAEPQRILVSMGAADPEGWTLKLLQELLPAFPDLEWQVMLTASFEPQYHAALLHFADAHPQVTLHPDLDAEAVCSLMESCGFALVSASTTLFEVWSRGIFAAAMAYTDNQRLIYEGMVQQAMAFPFLAREARASLAAYLAYEGNRCRRSTAWNPPAALRKLFEELAA